MAAIARLPQRGGERVRHLHADDIAEHRGERPLPVRIEIPRELLQAPREFGVALDPQLAHRRRVVATEHRQLPEQAGQRAAHAEVGFASGIERADPQRVALDPHFQRQRRRLDLQRDAASVQRAQRRLRIRIERERGLSAASSARPAGCFQLNGVELMRTL